MASKYAVVIAIERYLEAAWSPVRFAKADALGTSDALEQLGFEKDNQQLLLNDDATKARIDSKLRRAVDRLTAEDELFVYFAGHGFSHGNMNYLVCYDTVRHDMRPTSMALQDILDFLRTSRCHKIALFLDCCHSEPPLREDDRSIVDVLDDNQLRTFFDESQYFVCFSACKTSEKSYPSQKHEHGIWTHHLLEALTANAPEAIERADLVTSRSLQSYLSSQVPLTLREARQGLVTQTPVLYGSMTRDFIVADLSKLLAARRAAATAILPTLERVAFRSESSVQVKSLCGFKKWHRVPGEVSSATTEFLHTISESEVDAEVSKFHGILRSGLGYVRKDLRVHRSSGSATLFTPDFSLEIEIHLDPDDTAQAIMQVELVNITNGALLTSPSFNDAFGGLFDTIEFEYSSPFPLTELVDGLEAADDNRFALDYPASVSNCRIRVEGLDFEVFVTDHCVRLEFGRGCPPAQMLQDLAQADKMLLTEHSLKLLPS